MNLSDMLNIVAAKIIAIGGDGGIIFGLSSWLGKLWANRLLEQQKNENMTALEQHKNDLAQGLESFKNSLAKEKDSEIEKLKNELSLISTKYQTEHSMLFTQRVEILKTVYESLMEIQRQASNSLWFINASRNPQDIRSNAQKYYDDIMDSGDYFRKSRIFLEPDLCDKIENVFSEVGHTAGQFLATLGVYDDHEISETDTIRDDSWKKVKLLVNPAIEEVENEFRNIMLAHESTVNKSFK